MISASEEDYLLSALQFVFPAQQLTPSDVMATFSGLRPVVNTGKANPSKESREYAIWDEDGLLTVSGGKLTTFRIMARDALTAVRRHLGAIDFDPETPVLDVIPAEAEAFLAGTRLDASQRLRLLARYGTRASTLFSAADKELEPICGLQYLWAELRQAARAEAIVHLDDLLLRRVRLGLLTPEGGLPLLGRVRGLVQDELGWDDSRWQAEVDAYTQLWRTAYRFGSG